MKKFVVGLLITVLFAACNSTPEGYVLNGELRGDVENGTKVFLKTADSLRRALIDIDTATVENGQFTFLGNSDVPQMYYLFIDGIRGNCPIIMENGEIIFKAQVDSLTFAEIKGTPQNNLFMDYMEESRRLGSMSKTMNDDFRKASLAKDTATVEALRAEYFELQERAKDFELDFVKAHPDALISALILEKIMASKVLPFDEVQSLYEALTPEVKNSKPGKRMEKELEKAKTTAIGTKAPDFSGPTPNGEQLALNDVKGKLTLIDFWAAWCKPCRMENPNIVSVYEKYKDKGLNVVGVSLDRKKEDWIKAIESDGLSWNHVSHLQYFNDPIAQMYQVNAIPAAFLLDENGVIVAKNLRGPALEQKVAELLN
ncbi:TlpA disulfide reductase family protein [Flavobacteriaceae bacterium GF1]